MPARSASTARTKKTSTTPPSDQSAAHLYEQVADRVHALIAGGTLRPGARIPSVRRMAQQLSVSVTTVLEAYSLLEDRGLIEARPQSGYYVRYAPAVAPPEPATTRSGTRATALSAGDVVMRLVGAANRGDLVPLGAAHPSAELLPSAQLNRILARVARRDPASCLAYDRLPGREDLRIQIARRLLEAGCSVRPDEIVITNGAQEALFLSLRAITKPGDTVAIETPTYYGLLEILELLHLRALEIATDPRDGLCLEALDEALERQPGIAACVLVPSFGNPLGHNMPLENRRQLVARLAARGIPIVEDDTYGELCFGPTRPRALKAFDRTGSVLLCSSFSKTLAPGYRIGWAVPGRHRDAVERFKFSSSVASATPTQMAVAAYLADGGFDRYLRWLRRQYRDLMQRMICAISRAFPAGTAVTRPSGGHVLWVELPAGVESRLIYEQALEAGISVAPGFIFSPSGRYQRFLRINCAVSWDHRVEHAVETLGGLVARALP